MQALLTKDGSTVRYVGTVRHIGVARGGAQGARAPPN